MRIERNSLSDVRRRFLPKEFRHEWRSVKRSDRDGVKNETLFERSEFVSFSRRPSVVAL